MQVLKSNVLTRREKYKRYFTNDKYNKYIIMIE